MHVLGIKDNVRNVKRAISVMFVIIPVCQFRNQNDVFTLQNWEEINNPE